MRFPSRSFACGYSCLSSRHIVRRNSFRVAQPLLAVPWPVPNAVFYRTRKRAYIGRSRSRLNASRTLLFLGGYKMKSSDCRFVSWALFTAALAFCFPSSAAAQGTPADYQRAAGLQAKYEAAAIDIAGPATWIGNTHRFWYRKLSRGAYEFIVADADTLQKQPAFDHEKIAQSLSKAAGNSYTANKLPSPPSCSRRAVPRSALLWMARAIAARFRTPRAGRWREAPRV